MEILSANITGVLHHAQLFRLISVLSMTVIALPLCVPGGLS